MLLKPRIIAAAVIFIIAIGILVRLGTEKFRGRATSTSATSAEPAAPAAPIEDITGVYHCEGKDYKGTTIIRKSGDAYQLIWSIGPTTHQGVGLRNGEWLSSSWLPDNTRAVPGIVVYHIEKGGVLRGTYTSHPGGRVEEETLTYKAPIN